MVLTTRRQQAEALAFVDQSNMASSLSENTQRRMKAYCTNTILNERWGMMRVMRVMREVNIE